jgi:TM2 domain-containing membrane protein YozV
VRTASRADAAKAALLSALVIPGAGQMYNREWIKGVFIALVFLASSVMVLIYVTLAIVGRYLALAQGDAEAAIQATQPLWQMKYPLFTLLLVAIFLYLYSIFDAYRQAQKQTANSDREEMNG